MRLGVNRGETTSERSVRSDLFLRGLLATTILASGLAFLPGKVDGRLAFVLYREPKLAATLIGVWWFLALFLCFRHRRLHELPLKASVRSPPVGLLAILLFLFAVSTLWAKVPANSRFELGLYLPLFMLVVLVSAWMRSDPRVRSTVELSLIIVAALATVVGALQAVFEPRWLTAINPYDEVNHPSVMGYKNPMALAIGGQLFLLLGRIVDTSRQSWRGLMMGCALAELWYLGQLESRTSLAAITLAGVALLITAAVWPSRRLPWRRLAAGAGLAVVLLGIGVTALPGARQKALSLLTYATDPSAYLESDRGIYLRNTLNMVRHRPWGVGAGDWQTHYPIYRLHDRYRAFDEAYQVRRAHSDPVQILGENGWLGLSLWGAFLAAVVGQLAGSYRKSRRLADLFLLGQIVFWIAAMATDYVLDLPFHRLAFFLLIAGAVGSSARASGSAAEKPTSEGDSLEHLPIWTLRACVGMTLVAALLSSVVALSALRLAHNNAVMTRLYLQALDRPGPEKAALLRRAASHGTTLLRTSFHSKTRYKDWQVLADVYRRLGRIEAARRCAEQALELHPYSPKTFQLLANLHRGEQRRRWQEGYEYIMHTATSGYPLDFPGS